MATQFIPERIDHVEVFVADIAAAARWYREVLGLEEVSRWEPEPVMIGAGGTLLALFQGKGAAGSEDAGWHRVAWRTDAAGFAAAQEHLREREIRFRGPVDHGRSQSVYFEDLDGNPLEITTYR